MVEFIHLKNCFMLSVVSQKRQYPQLVQQPYDYHDKRGRIDEFLDGFEEQAHFVNPNSVRFKRTRNEEMISVHAQPPPPPGAKHRFTFNQLLTLVRQAVAKRETELREEYDQILQERLEQQWKEFAEFNRNNLHSSGYVDMTQAKNYMA
jgi:hypothetical protein